MHGRGLLERITKYGLEATDKDVPCSLDRCPHCLDKPSTFWRHGVRKRLFLVFAEVVYRVWTYLGRWKCPLCKRTFTLYPDFALPYKRYPQPFIVARCAAYVEDRAGTYWEGVREEDKAPAKVRYPRQAAGLEAEKEQRDPDLDPQLVWRGKDQQDWSDLVVQAAPLYIQEKVHPKVLIDDLMRVSTQPANDKAPEQGDFTDLFADFNGIPEGVDKTEFYQHEANWSNRMILGDSLQVMASLAEREGLRGKVQCIYIDPPYGIKFNSNFQWSTTSRDVKDGNAAHITREPEQVKAFRDTWRDGIYSYLTYLRDRLTVARDLLTGSGSIFVQIGDENVHRVRALLDEVFGDENFVSEVVFTKTRPLGASGLVGIFDVILWYGKSKPSLKFRPKFEHKSPADNANYALIEDAFGQRRRLSSAERQNFKDLRDDLKVFQGEKLASSGWTKTCFFNVEFQGKRYNPKKTSWRTNRTGMERLIRANHIYAAGNNISYVSYIADNPLQSISNPKFHGASRGSTCILALYTGVLRR